MRHLFYCLVIAITFQYCSEPEGYAIEGKVEGLNNTQVFLAYYYGETSFITDTTMSDANGEFRFEGKETLPHGVYAVAQRTNTLFDFVIGKDQHFSLTTKPLDYTGNMIVSGDVDNELYFEYLKYDARQREEAKKFVNVINDSTVATAERKKAEEAFDALREKVVEYQRDVVKRHPQTTTAVLFSAGLPPEQPDSSMAQYRDHFFDNFDLGNEILIRIPHPVYRDKINEYLDNLVPQHPDSIIKAIDKMAAKAKANEETYKYLVLKCMQKYQDHTAMGMDKVFVHLVDTYFLSGEMDYWANDQLKKNIKEIADPIRNSMIGEKAPDLVMEDLQGKTRSLHDVKSNYTIIYFFDPDCGLCQAETPKLVRFYNQNKEKLGVEVFAVSADTSRWKTREYVRDAGLKWITVSSSRSKVTDYMKLYDARTTPTLYVLDNNKKIIAKKLRAEDLEGFLTYHASTEEQP